MTWAGSAVSGGAGHVPLRCAPLALAPQGMRFSVIVIDVAAPGRSARHPGITPGGVICGDSW